MIELDGLGYARPDGARVLRDLSLRIAEGERVVVLGANGCGKSTLLKLLDGLVFPDRGAYRYRGEGVTAAGFRDRAWSRRFRREVALLFQHPDAMLFNASVREEIAYGPRQLGLDRVAARVDRWARELDLDGVMDRPPFTLSGGQKQKLCLAALLVLEPRVLILDEPTANLDPRSTGRLVDLLMDLQATTIVSTHSISMAPELGERCLILDEGGRAIYDGPVEPALADLDLLERANLVHRHRHRHGGMMHTHRHLHDWD
jgi:cobalt/nickel transport system ATP-binding protein